MNPSSSSKLSKFNSKGFLVTIPHLPISKCESELQRISSLILIKEQSLNQEVTALASSLEEHELKGVHLHFAISFKNRRTISSPYFNWLFNKQAHIQKICWKSKRSRFDAFSYVLKTGLITFSWGDVSSILGPEKRQYSGALLSDLVTKLIEEGCSLSSLESHPLIEVRSFAMAHSSMIASAIKRRETRIYEHQQNLLPGFTIQGNQSSLSPEKKLILSWLSKIPINKHSWPLRECCLLIVGEPKKGKSTLINHISSLVPSYRFPSCKWFTHYRNSFYSIISWEEPLFDHFDISFIKRLVEGQEIDLPIKGDMSSKRDRPLFIFTSNDSIKQLYARAFLSSYEREHCSLSSSALCHCQSFKSCPLSIGNHHLHFEAIKSRICEVNLKKQSIFDLLPFVIANNQQMN